MIFVLNQAMNTVLFGLIISVFVLEGNLTCCEGNKITESLSANYCLQTIKPVLDKAKILHQEFNKCHEAQKNSTLERLESLKHKLATNIDDEQQNIDNRAAEILNTFSNIEKQVEKIESLQKKLNERLEAHSKTFQSKVNVNVSSVLEKFNAIEKNVNVKISNVMKKIDSSDNLIIKTSSKCKAIRDLVPLVVQPPFKQIGSKHYYIEHEKICNWFVAGDKCRELGGHLVSFQSQEEFDAVKTQLSGINYWIDINDLGEEGEFISIVTGLKPSYTNWHSGEPNNGYNGKEHCGDLWYYNNKHLMNDHICQEEMGFICELANNY